ncbi:hypothetical protein [Novosphingobium sp.]|uniref:hypothetical protein n=1 Tax=Novosphingobium sp. TaxID=1874826 RepID=UPI00333EBC5A
MRKLWNGAVLLASLAIAVPAMATETTPEQVVVPTPPAGKAEVVFFRKAGFAGSAISCAPSENGTKISSLPPGRFAILVAEPGPHTYAGGSNVKDGVALNLKPGSITYVQCNIRVGFWAGMPVFDIAHDDDFSTKLWKSLTKEQLGPNILTDEQIKTALAAQAAQPAVTPAAAPVATPAPATEPTVAAPATTAAPAMPAATATPPAH